MIANLPEFTLDIPEFVCGPLQYDWVAGNWRSLRWLALGNYE